MTEKYIKYWFRLHKYIGPALIAICLTFTLWSPLKCILGCHILQFLVSRRHKRRRPLFRLLPLSLRRGRCSTYVTSLKSSHKGSPPSRFHYPDPIQRGTPLIRPSFTCLPKSPAKKLFSMFLDRTAMARDARLQTLLYISFRVPSVNVPQTLP